MVKKIQEESKTYYQCEECSFLYLKESLANKCAAWCKKHHSCNLEITKQAVKKSIGENG